MLRKFVILFLLLCTLPAISAPVPDNGGHAGTPAGFYDDIDPDSLDEELSVPDYRKENAPIEDDEDAYQTFQEGEFSTPPAQTKATKNYAQIYAGLEVPEHSYLHGIDPDQYYDMKDAAWSPYPLIRLNSPIYFKSLTIEPGYYLLTPREHKDKWYILFKQNGVVTHIIPVYERDYTPEMFYDEHIPKPKLTKAQKIHMGVLDFLGNFNSTKRKTPVQSYLEVNDLENYFVSIVIYYGSHKYSTIFRTIRL